MPCYRPVQTTEEIFPCRYCVGCKKERSQGKAILAHLEASLHSQNYFVTLTHDDDNIPPSWSVRKSYVQDFIRALRRRVGKVRFLACGEYGAPEKGRRPHYHAILFGADLKKGLIPWEPKDGNEYWRSVDVEKAWPYGFSNVSNVNFATCRYVAKYVVKKQNRGPDFRNPFAKYVEEYRRIDAYTGEEWYVEPEFGLQSLKPGLAHDWFVKYWRDVYPSDEVLIDGKAYKPPEYFDKLLARYNEPLWETVKSTRMRECIEKSYKPGSSFAVKERVMEERIKHAQKIADC